MDITALLEQMHRDGAFRTILGNPRAQLGRAGRNYLGATLLPEKNVPNRFAEQGIRYRSIIANSATRYSPVQIKGGVITGSFDVELGNMDIGSQFTGPEYDALIEMLTAVGTNPPTEGVMRNLLQWADVTLNVPLLELNEKQRWDAIVDSAVVRTGDNKYTETVSYYNPSGHRVAAAGAWSNNSIDPMTDIMNGVDFLHGKGYEVNRIIAGRPVLSKLSMNEKMRARAGVVSLAAGVTVGLNGRIANDEINTILGRNGIPAVEEYNLQYRTDTGSGYFLKRDVMVLVATTGRDEDLDLGDNEFLPMRDTLGYFGIGRPQGQADYGRHMVTEAFDRKPFRVEGEAWQTGLPVITEPEAIYVITGIS